MAEEAVVNGKADAVGFVRPLIADPDMVKKHHEGKTEQIRFCARDNQGCVSRINQSKPITCVQNPNVGRESISVSETIIKALKPKRVVVMGAGPAGMAAAVAAMKRGHSVTLYEQDDKSGGQVNLSLMGAGRSSMARMIRYLENTLTRLGVSVFYNTPMHAEDVVTLNADVVVIATGCEPVSHPYPGEYGPPTVLSVWDVLKGSYPWGEKILFIDEIGNHSTLACVELLAEQGGKVDLVTNDLFVGIGIATLGDLYFTRQRLLQKGVTFQTDIAVDKIEDRKVFAKNVFTNTQIIYEGYDTIIAAADFVAVDQLYHNLKGKVHELYRVGDCVAPRGIEMAIYEGEKVGSRL
jgi:ribulose 1,5-bisphosphate synthetase/thiazole synthase